MKPCQIPLKEPPRKGGKEGTMLNNMKFVFVSIAIAHDLTSYNIYSLCSLIWWQKACLFYFGLEYFKGM
jgi:hypothetical protein